VFHKSSNKASGSEGPGFRIEDGSQAVELVAKDRNSIVATFSCFLLKNIGIIEIFRLITFNFLITETSLKNF